MMAKEQIKGFNEAYKKVKKMGFEDYFCLDNIKSIKTKCPNKKCLYKWDYKGDNPFYACCPRCKRSVNIQKNRGKK